MAQSRANMAHEIARVAKTFEQQRTGHGPKSVTIVLSDDVLVITLHGALSEAEKALARAPEGAAQVQEFHRQLFASAAETPRKDIERITGVKVREATAPLRKWFSKVAHHRGKKTAIVALVRKRLVIAYHLLREETVHDAARLRKRAS